MLTAAGSIEDRVDGLNLGADDYLPKPFAFAELVARVRAPGGARARPLPASLVHGDLRVDPANRLASRDGQRLALSPKEFAVLEYLLGAEGRVVSSEELLRAGLGRERRPVHHDRQGHDQAPARKARRAAADRDRAPRRLPDLSATMSAPETLQAKAGDLRSPGGASVGGACAFLATRSGYVSRSSMAASSRFRERCCSRSSS